MADTPEPKSAALARDAWLRGQAAMAANDRADAIRWFDRARRLAPADGNIRLALAAASLDQDNARAAELFESVAAESDAREAWFGLAAVRLRLEDRAGAAHALARALQRHAPAPGLDNLADAIVSASASPGWCGLLGSGVVIARPAWPGTLETRLDGRRLAGRIPPTKWASAGRLTVTLDGRPLLGSPIEVAAIGRVEGCAEPWEGGIRGWAGHPGDPETDPELTITPAAGGGTALRIVARTDDITVADSRVLSRVRGFKVTAKQIAGLPGPVRIQGRDGRDLLGSPLDPGAMRRLESPDTLGSGAGPPLARDDQPPPADVVIPVHGHPGVVLACLETVLRSAGGAHRIVVVDDASPEPDLSEVLNRLAAEQRILLLRHKRPLGFPASANAGIAACIGHDVVLLNSDTLVPPGWLDRLRQAAYLAPDIGTVTPFSNNASIMTYPRPEEPAPPPNWQETVRLDAMAHRANGGDVVEVPVGVGFCLYMKRACLDAVGPLRADVFAQGYGEENDFCLRAGTQGWRHVGLPGLFVAHFGGTSFGRAATHLRLRNEHLLNRMHPGYNAMIEAFAAADPLAEARRRLDLVRWRGMRPGRRGSVILVTHGDGGGVEQRIVAASAACRANGHRPIVLRPAPHSAGREAVVVCDGPDGGFPNLCYALPREMPALLRLLRAARPVSVEVHHFLNHPSAIHELVTNLGVQYAVHIHDFAWFCPRVALVDGTGRYCGEPDVTGCEACIAKHGRLTAEEIGVKALRKRSAAFLARADRVIVPSHDTATRIGRHFPALRPLVLPYSDDAAEPLPPRTGGDRDIHRVCIVGAIGVHKGYDILLACARDAANRSLPLEFVIIGDTIDDDRLFATGRVFITGTYKAHDGAALIRAQDASLGFLPSICPETWSLTLTELWRAGLPVAAFDIGAPGERIRATGRGFVLPLGLPPGGINDTLLFNIKNNQPAISQGNRVKEQNGATGPPASSLLGLAR